MPTTTTWLIAELTDGRVLVTSKTTEDFRGDSTAAGDLLRRTVSTYSLRRTKVSVKPSLVENSVTSRAVGIIYGSYA